MIAFKKQVDGLLSGHQVHELRNQLGLNQSQAAAIFGGGPTAFSKYESDDVMQSEPMDKLLRVAKDIPDAYFHLAGISDKPTGTIETASNNAAHRAAITSPENVIRNLLALLQSMRKFEINRPAH